MPSPEERNQSWRTSSRPQKMKRTTRFRNSQETSRAAAPKLRKAVYVLIVVKKASVVAFTDFRRIPHPSRHFEKWLPVLQMNTPESPAKTMKGVICWERCFSQSTVYQSLTFPRSQEDQICRRRVLRLESDLVLLPQITTPEGDCLLALWFWF